MAIGDVIARLAVSLALETAAFEKGATISEKRVEQMRRKFVDTGKRIAVGLGAIGAAVGTVVYQFRDMAHEAIDSAKKIDILAGVANAGVEEFQKASYAAKSVGIESEKLSDIYKDVNDKVGDFIATGGGAMADFFENIAPKVGVTAEQFEKLSGPQALQLYVSSLEKAGVSQQQMTFYLEALASDATVLLPLLENNGKAMGEFAKQADELGLVMSSEEIAKAKEVASNLALLNAQIEAQSNKKILENADSIMQFEEGLSTFKLVAIDAVVQLQNLGKGLDTLQAVTRNRLLEIKQSWIDIGNSIQSRVNAITGWLDGLAMSANASLRNMVNSIRSWIIDKLGGVWDAAKAKVEEVRQSFFNLWDKVTRRSYVPDMVDDIASEMKRLDTVMVAQVGKATSATERAFLDMQMRVGGILARLFPESAQLADYRSDLATLEDAFKKGEISADKYAEAVKRLGRELAGVSVDGKFTKPVAVEDVTPQAMDVKSGLKQIADAANDNANRTRIATVRIADSFKDMAEKTMRSFQSLSNAIKGGGFLDILEAGVGLFLQLGSTGLFGKGLAANINKTPGYANGTNFHPGGLAVVGERGPELVNMPRGSQVFSNRESMGMMGGKLQVEVVANNNGFGAIVRNHAGEVVAEAAPTLMNGGASIANQQQQFQRSRRLA